MILYGQVNNYNYNQYIYYNYVFIYSVIIPYDGSPLAQTDPILLYVFIPIYVFSISTIVFAVICALVNFILRKRK